MMASARHTDVTTPIVRDYASAVEHARAVIIGGGVGGRLQSAPDDGTPRGRQRGDGDDQQRRATTTPSARGGDHGPGRRGPLSVVTDA